MLQIYLVRVLGDRRMQEAGKSTRWKVVVNWSDAHQRRTFSPVLCHTELYSIMVVKRKAQAKTKNENSTNEHRERTFTSCRLSIDSPFQAFKWQDRQLHSLIHKLNLQYLLKVKVKKKNNNGTKWWQNNEHWEKYVFSKYETR